MSEQEIDELRKMATHYAKDPSVNLSPLSLSYLTAVIDTVRMILGYGETIGKEDPSPLEYLKSLWENKKQAERN